MSTFDVIEIEGKGFKVSTETNSGCMDNAERELEQLRFWRKQIEPYMQLTFLSVERELDVLSQAPDGPKLIRNPLLLKGKTLETVWEEKMDGMDVPAHIKKGNGSCIYRMRLWPKAPVNKVDVQLIVESLPSPDARENWKAKLQAGIERDVKYDDKTTAL
jgi:hypothetical protein